MAFKVPEQYRLVTPQIGPHTYGDLFGVFLIPSILGNRNLYVIASNGEGEYPWEHVSVHAYEGKKTKIPTWLEMDHVKNLFWDDTDVAFQLHPPRSEWVNNHPSVLHLWRCTDGREVPLPPPELVGVKGVEGEEESRKVIASGELEGLSSPAKV